MKAKVTLISLLTILIFVGVLFVSNKSVIAKFLNEENSKPIRTFEDYSQMTSLKERIAAVNTETPRNKSLLWRQNLLYQANLMNLNEEQKAWVKELHDLIDEDFFAVGGRIESEFAKTELGKPYEKLMIQRSQLFTQDQAKKFCSVIGDEATLINSRQATSDDDDPEGPVYCYCTSSMCPQCPSELTCITGECNATPDNCGCFGFWQCTGQCRTGLPAQRKPSL